MAQTFNFAAWNRLVDQTQDKINQLSVLKGGEYAGDTDRLANFRRNAAQTHVPMEVVWSIYYNKHHDAVMQYVQDIQDGVVRDRSEPLSGRVDDMIVYLILLKAILAERGDADLRHLIYDEFGYMREEATTNVQTKPTYMRDGPQRDPYEGLRDTVAQEPTPRTKPVLDGKTFGAKHTPEAKVEVPRPTIFTGYLRSTTQSELDASLEAFLRGKL